MKKFITAFLCLTLCLFSITFFGCGNDAFAGNYKEATKEDVTLYAQEITDKEAKTTIDYSTGVEMKLDTNMTIDSVAMNAKIDFKMALVNDSLAMSGNMKATMNGQDVNSAVYYNNGYFYTNVSVVGVDVKIKQKVGIEEFIGSNFDVYAPEIAGIDLESLNLNSLLAMTAEYENVKFYIDSNEKEIKVKAVAVIPAETDGGEDLTVNYYVLLDANKNLLGAKIEFGSKTYGSFNASIAPYSGKVDIPKDSEYTDWSTLLQ